jgi:hypothetical protein
LDALFDAVEAALTASGHPGAAVVVGFVKSLVDTALAKKVGLAA